MIKVTFHDDFIFKERKRLSKLAHSTLVNGPLEVRLGVFAIYQNIRNSFRLGWKWKGYFGLPGRKISEVNGTSSEVVQNRLFAGQGHVTKSDHVNHNSRW